jgi:uncharacterized protein YbaP (TraB family)
MGGGAGTQARDDARGSARYLPLMLKRFLAALLLALPVAASAKGPALWAVKDADTTVYLFGTVHMLPKGVDWLSGRTRQAFEKSDTLVTEIVLPEPRVAAKAMMTRGLSDKVPPLKDRVPPAKLPALSAAVAASGLPRELLDRMDSWFAAMTLTRAQLAGMEFAPGEGVEEKLSVAARGKARVGLETLDEQLGFFDGLPEADQRALLAATLDGLPELKQQAGQLVRLWASGDTDRLAAQLNEDLRTTPRLAQLLLTDRNARWADWIAARLDKPGTVFVAVGAGHLAGSDSVQAMLAKKGLRAERVK